MGVFCTVLFFVLCCVGVVTICAAATAKQLPKYDFFSCAAISQQFLNGRNSRNA